MTERRQITVSVVNPTADDYRKAGENAARKLLEDYHGRNGPEKMLAARNKGWVCGSVANAVNDMDESGATAEQIKAWLAGLAAAFSAHADELELQNQIELAFLGLTDLDRLPGRGRHS